FSCDFSYRDLPSFPTRRSSDLFSLMDRGGGAARRPLVRTGLADLHADTAVHFHHPSGEVVVLQNEGDGVGDLLGFAHPAQGDLLDRKSTRLNSSHVKISYAVFC